MVGGWRRERARPIRCRLTTRRSPAKKMRAAKSITHTANIRSMMLVAKLSQSVWCITLKRATIATANSDPSKSVVSLRPRLSCTIYPSIHIYPNHTQIIMNKMIEGIIFSIHWPLWLKQVEIMEFRALAKLNRLIVMNWANAMMPTSYLNSMLEIIIP